MGRKLLAALMAALMLGTTALAAAPEPESPEEPPETEAVEPEPAAEPEEAEIDSGAAVITPLELGEPVEMEYSWMPGDERVSLFMTQKPWVTGSTTYGEQLDEDEKAIYDGLAEAFADGTVEYGETSSSTPAAFITVELGRYEAVNSDPRLILDQIDAARDERKAAANLLLVQSDNPVFNAMNAFTLDHPEYFWIRTDYGFWTSGEEQYLGADGEPIQKPTTANLKTYVITLDIVMHYNIEAQFLDEAVRNEKSEAVNKQMNAILAACEGLPTVSKLAYFDEWLATNNAYNTAAGNNSAWYMQSGPQRTAPWNITGALIDGLDPVCESYSKTFQLLCSKIGLACIPVSSSNHMWNLVQLEDGKWYYVDCTWNDPNYTGGGSSPHSNRKYFLIIEFEGSNDRGESHNVEQDFPIPERADTAYDVTGWTMQGVTDSRGTGYAAYYDGDQRLVKAARADCFHMEKDGNKYDLVLLPKLTNEILKAEVTGRLFALDSVHRPTASPREVNLTPKE